MTPDDAEWEARNWARWAHSDDGVASVVSSLWRFWLPSKHRDDGWGESIPERIEDPIDEVAAVRCDVAIRHLSAAHWRTIRLHYLRGRRQPEAEVGAALRALGMAIDAGATKVGAWRTA